MDFILREDNKPFIWGLVQREFHEFLFKPSGKNPPIEEQLYLFMKRFRTQPSEFFAMNRELRLSLYHREFRLLELENEEAEKARKPTKK